MKQRLEKWFNSLTKEQKKEAALQAIGYLIDTDTVCFYGDSRCPYWEATGETLDGSTEPIY